MNRIILRNIVIIAIVVAFFAGVKVTAQKSQKKAEPVIKANVLVTRPDGQYAEGIKQSDIKVFENGVEQPITYFDTKDKGLNVLLVVDNSGSFHKKLEEEVVIGKTIVTNLADKDESMLIRFVDRTKITKEQLWTTNKTEMVHGHRENELNIYGKSSRTFVNWDNMNGRIFYFAQKAIDN